MSVAQLERELRRWRDGEPPSLEDVVPLSREAALAHRDAGNIPDELGRSLRLVLHVSSEDDLRRLDEKRREWEPDHLEAPTWRRPGSVPVNVVPLRNPDVQGKPVPWWEDPRTGPLEREWRESGTVAGMKVPEAYLAFVIKTVIALQAAGRPVTVETVVGAISRWLDPVQVDEIATALEVANRPQTR